MGTGIKLKFLLSDVYRDVRPTQQRAPQKQVFEEWLLPHAGDVSSPWFSASGLWELPWLRSHIRPKIPTPSLEKPPKNAWEMLG